MLREFVDATYPPHIYPNDFPGEVCLFFAPPKGTPKDSPLKPWSMFLPLEVPRGFDAEDHERLVGYNKTHSIYIANSLYRPGIAKGRGTRDDVVAMSSIVLDVDMFDPDGAHADMVTLPRTDDEVISIIANAPEPTIMVKTGHGWQFWWVFDEPVILDSKEKQNRAESAIRSFQRPIRDHAMSLGFHVDQTDQLGRIWRLPGYNNMKVEGKPVPVECVTMAGPRYKAAAFGLNIAGLPTDPNPVATPEVKTTTTTKSRKKLKTARARVLLKSRNEKKKPEPDPGIALLLEGKALAEPGNRNAELNRVCSVVAFTLEGKGEPEELVELFDASLRQWSESPVATKTLEEERATAIDSLRRAQEGYDKKKEKAAAVSRALGIKLPDGTEMSEQHLIIQKGRAYYVYVSAEERYAGPFIKDELVTAVRDYFEVDTTYDNAKGETKDMQPPMLTKEYGTIAEKIQGSLSLRRSYYDRKENTFMIATTPLRKLEPRFDVQIDTWLRLMAVDEGDTEQILDYVAGVSQLHRPCAALHLMGPPGTGKSVFIEGLSKLWTTGGATPYRMAVGAAFNESIATCPLIELSEGTDEQGFIRGTSSAFRDLIGSVSVKINPKGLTPYSVTGCARVVIASNDYEILRDITGGRELSNEALEAVAERLAIVPVGLPAKEYMNALKANDPHTIDRWLQEDLLARHALHLRDSRPLSKDARFLIHGKVTAAMQTLVVHRPPSEALLEWIVGFATDPGEFNKGFSVNRVKPHSRIGNGELLLNSTEIQKKWTAYMDEKVAPKPSVTGLGRMLGKLGKSGAVNKMVDGKQATVRQIDPTYPINFSIENQIGDVEKIKANLERKIDD